MANRDPYNDRRRRQPYYDVNDDADDWGYNPDYDRNSDFNLYNRNVNPGRDRTPYYQRGMDQSGGNERRGDRGWDQNMAYNRGRNAPSFNQRNRGDYQNWNRYDQGFDEDWDYDTPTFVYTEEYWLVPGPFSGVGPNGYQRSDERILEDVCERLTQHGQVDASDVEVDVHQGEVTLRGNVENRRMKRMTEDTVESIPGVVDVHNQLHVRHHQGQPHQRQAGQMSGQVGRAGDLRGRIHEGMEVVDADGSRVGKVKEVRENDFLVDRTLARDVYIPFSACHLMDNDQVMLNDVKADQVDAQDWPHPEIFKTPDFLNKNQ